MPGIAIGFEKPKTVIISAAVTCLEVPALSSDLLTKVRNPSH
jgi:hypothetical protein